MKEIFELDILNMSYTTRGTGYMRICPVVLFFTYESIRAFYPWVFWSLICTVRVLSKKNCLFVVVVFFGGGGGGGEGALRCG